MGKKTPREKSVGKGSDEGDEDFRKKGGEGMRFHRRGEKLTRTEKKQRKTETGKRRARRAVEPKREPGSQKGQWASVVGGTFKELLLLVRRRQRGGRCRRREHTLVGHSAHSNRG